MAARCLLLNHEEAKLESLLLGRGNASYSPMRKLSRKVFYSAVVIPSTQLRRCLLLDHEEAESESLLLSRSDAFYLAIR